MFNEPRNIAIYLVRQIRRETLSKIGQYFEINNFSSVSSVINRLEIKIKSDKKLINRVREIKFQLIKSQE